VRSPYIIDQRLLRLESLGIRTRQGNQLLSFALRHHSVEVRGEREEEAEGAGLSRQLQQCWDLFSSHQFRSYLLCIRQKKTALNDTLPHVMHQAIDGFAVRTVCWTTNEPASHTWRCGSSSVDMVATLRKGTSPVSFNHHNSIVTPVLVKYLAHTAARRAPTTVC